MTVKQTQTHLEQTDSSNVTREQNLPSDRPIAELKPRVRIRTAIRAGGSNDQ